MNHIRVWLMMTVGLFVTLAPARTTAGEINAPLSSVEQRWSKQRARIWYENQPWLCGFNNVPANAISYTEMWMSYCLDVALIDRELSLAHNCGINCLRSVLPFVVWEHDSKALKHPLDTFLSTRARWVLDLYNKSRNGGLGGVTISLVECVLNWAREMSPPQSLTIGQWNDNAALNVIILRHSHIIAFHNYGNVEQLVRRITTLRDHDRPIINTEWLNRGRGSTAQACLPVFIRENVSCLHWGLVNGRTQTHLYWGWRPGRGEPDIWQHDLYHANHTPYDPEEHDQFRQSVRPMRSPKP